MLVSIQTKSATFSDWGMMNGQMHRLSLILFWFSRRLQNLSWYFSADIQPAASFPRRGTEQYIGKRNTRSILTKNDVIPPWIDKLMVPYGKELLFTLCGVKILIVPLSRCRWSFTSIPDEWVTHFLSPQAIESVTWENAEDSNYHTITGSECIIRDPKICRGEGGGLHHEATVFVLKCYLLTESLCLSEGRVEEEGWCWAAAVAACFWV